MFSRFCLWVLLLCTVLPVSAEQPPIRFLTADVWPWGYLNSEGEPAGLIAEFAERLSEVSGHPLDNRVVPHQRVIHSLQFRQADVTVVFENPALQQAAMSLGEVLRTDVLLLTLRDSSLSLDLGALSDVRVGFIRGTYYGEVFAAKQDIVKIPVHSMAQGIEMLELGRLDAMMSSDIVFLHTLKTVGLDAAEFRFAAQVSGQPALLYISRQALHPEQADALRSALETLRASGELARLFAKPSLEDHRQPYSSADR